MLLIFTTGSAVGLVDSGCGGSGRGLVRGERKLVLDRGEATECAATGGTVVGVLDPKRDRVMELIAGGPVMTVQDVLLQKRSERVHRGVIAGGGDPTYLM